MKVFYLLVKLNIHYLLKRDDPLCVSNEVKGDYTIIENNENIILVRSRDAK